MTLYLTIGVTLAHIFIKINGRPLVINTGYVECPDNYYGVDEGIVLGECTTNHEGIEWAKYVCVDRAQEMKIQFGFYSSPDCSPSSETWLAPYFCYLNGSNEVLNGFPCKCDFNCECNDNVPCASGYSCNNGFCEEDSSCDENDQGKPCSSGDECTDCMFCCEKYNVCTKPGVLHGGLENEERQCNDGSGLWLNRCEVDGQGDSSTIRICEDGALTITTYVQSDDCTKSSLPPLPGTGDGIMSSIFSNDPCCTYSSAKAMLNIHNDEHGVNGVSLRFYQEAGFGYILVVGVILFILINNVFIGYWCVCKKDKINANVEYEKCEIVNVDDE